MRKLFWMTVVVLMGLASLGALNPAETLTRLTIINKADLPVEVRLEGAQAENFYFLRVSAGSRDDPTTQVFTIARDSYEITSYYVEMWDPVHGNRCDDPSKRTLSIKRNTRITFFDCDAPLPNGGAPTMLKFPAGWPFLY